MNRDEESGESSDDRVTHTFPYGNRVIRGKCHWDMSPDVTVKLAELRQWDPFAAAGIQGQIEEAAGDGLGASSMYEDELDYRCPLRFAPDGVPDPPWLGEFKAHDHKRTEWRLYFGEAINFQDHVVGVTLRDSKLAHLSGQQNTERQRKHITQAARYLKTFFRERGYCWAPFHDGGGWSRTPGPMMVR
ncbi:hypothetical protein [Nocardia aurantia]|uniref:Uncharacterized protein n=1 Tax=Nocardia aurantia TaxID=2585199 RepID=A0A7K0DHT2_9NOCA|nr:hypothetical protein [Nocardia aurantia]MQY25131.1 hypothetical protein [Nocardia aurantia]